MDIKRKRQKFNALLHVTHSVGSKEQILASFSANSTLDLTELQLDKVIVRLQHIAKEMRTDAEKETRELRHKCLRMIKECGKDTSDWNVVNSFLLDKRIAGKYLYEMSNQELISLHRKLHNVRDNILKKQKETERLTQMN